MNGFFCSSMQSDLFIEYVAEGNILIYNISLPAVFYDLNFQIHKAFFRIIDFKNVFGKIYFIGKVPFVFWTDNI